MKKYDPFHVKLAVNERDKFVCQICRKDMKQAVVNWRQARPNSHGPEFYAWSRSKPKIEYDHIVPFSRGGLTILENMRTLCKECHKTVTKEFARQRAVERAAKKIEAQATFDL